MQKEEEREEIRNFRPASAAFNLSFFKKGFLKSNKWIRMVGVFLLFFFHYYHQNFHINFWCWIFFKKATQLSFKFLARMFFWSKIIFDENFDAIVFFFSKATQKSFLLVQSKKLFEFDQVSMRQVKLKTEVTHNKKNYEFLFPLAKSRKWVCQKQKYNSFLRQDYYGGVGWGGVCLAPFTVLKEGRLLT